MENIDRMLVVLVDGTIKMAPYWDTIKTSILDTIIRKFCNSFTSPFKDPLDKNFCLKLIVFRARDDYNGVALHSYSSPDMDAFMSELSRITFTDHGIKLPVLEEGICAALGAFPVTKGRTEAELAGKRHCILVTANQLSIWRKYCSVPTNLTIDIGGATAKLSERIITDAELLAALFAETFISFSVICPKDITTIRKLYNAGNGFYQIPGYFPVEFKHPELLILISEKFPEAREALRNFEEIRETLPKHDSFFSLSRNFSVGQLHQLIQQAISEPSVQQQSPENLDEETVERPFEEMNTVDDDSNFEMQENYVPVTVTEEMDLWPYEEVGYNFEAESTAPSRLIVTSSNIGPSHRDGGLDEIKEKRTVISAIPAESGCSSSQPNQGVSMA